MSYTLTRNARLRITDGLSADARYNLERIDQFLGSVVIDTASVTHVRSRNNLILEPNAQALGGTGTGGTIYFGTDAHPLDAVEINAGSITFGGLGDVLTVDNTATVTNKTLDFAQNTFLNFPGASGLEGYTTTWIQADGLTKTVTHSLNSLAVGTFLIDLSDNSFSMINNTIVLDSNSVQLTASELPSVIGWQVVVIAV